jgi:hypothetical protein
VLPLWLRVGLEDPDLGKELRRRRRIRKRGLAEAAPSHNRGARLRVPAGAVAVDRLEHHRGTMVDGAGCPGPVRKVGDRRTMAVEAEVEVEVPLICERREQQVVVELVELADRKDLLGG